MNFDIEQRMVFSTYCDECGWESEADSEYALTLNIEALMWYVHEELGYSIDN